MVIPSKLRPIFSNSPVKAEFRVCLLFFDQLLLQTCYAN